MRRAIVLTTGAILAGALWSCAAAASAQTIELRDAVARVTVIPEARSDIKVEVLAANPQTPLRVRQSRDRTIIFGDLGHRIRGCDGDGVQSSVRVAGIGSVPWGRMAQVVVRTPREVKVAAGGAVFGIIGRAASIELGNAGCGDWVIGNTAGMLEVSEAGSGDLRAGTAGQARLRIAGSGDMDVAAVGGGLEVDVGGSGDVRVASVAGPFGARVAGSGDVTVRGGRASPMTVSIAGSGSVNFTGVADALKARVTGSGDINVRQVTGVVSSAVLGSGKVTVAGRMLTRRP
jgi:hypothetical protein